MLFTGRGESLQTKTFIFEIPGGGATTCEPGGKDKGWFSVDDLGKLDALAVGDRFFAPQTGSVRRTA